MLQAKDVGQAIQELRGETPREELADKASVEPSELSSYERGIRMPPEEALSRLVKALGVSEAEFDLRIIDHWRQRIGEDLPQSLEAKRLELYEHVQVIGLRLHSLVKTLDDMTLLQPRKGTSDE